MGAHNKMTMSNLSLRRFSAVLVVCGGALVSSSVEADSGKRAPAYGSFANVERESLEGISSIESLKQVGKANLAPTEIWRRLEHGEKVECLSCIPSVAKLLYRDNTKTREIAAWWLRRRVFGVFGPGQVYSQTLKTATDASKTTKQRAYAVQALGEFRLGAGIVPVTKALTEDASPQVRQSAAEALWRLDSEGPKGELSLAIADKDEAVRLEALRTASRIHSFSGLAAVVKRISDESPQVRKRAAEVLGVMRAKDAVVGLIALSQEKSESDPAVRAAAVAAMGRIGDPAARDAVQTAQSDSNGFVRDAARIAMRQL